MKALLRRLPRIQFGDPDAVKAPMNPVTTYYLIVVPALLLTLFGLVMGFSASAITRITAGESPYASFLRQFGIIMFSVAVAGLVHMIRPQWLRFATPFLFVGSLILQLLVLTPLGVTVGGNTNWVAIPGLGQLQPSEFIKLTLLLMLAMLLSAPGVDVTNLKQVGLRAGLPMLSALVAVMLGFDMGTAMVVAFAALGALWVAGLPGKWFAWVGVLTIPTLIALVLSNPSRLRRVLSVLPGSNKERNLSAPEQIDHSLWAFGSGGFTGLGPGASREKWNYLQEAHTDFILAILGEEFGLLGTLTVLACLGVLVWGMVRLAISTSKLYVSILVGGVATWIGAQAAINISSVTQLGPVIGVPLPLVSYGGSSFLFTAVAIGIVAAFARQEANMNFLFSRDNQVTGIDPRGRRRKRRPRRPQSQGE